MKGFTFLNRTGSSKPAPEQITLEEMLQGKFVPVHAGLVYTDDFLRT